MPLWNPTLNRRDALRRTACGFGSLALTGLLAERGMAASNPLAAKTPQFPARAKRVIFIFMGGGPSHVDSFDYKPQLIRDHQKKIVYTGYRFDDRGKAVERTMMKPLWEFQRHGDSGRWVSSLFPEIAKHVDDLCFLHSLHTDGVAHGPATLVLHTGAMNTLRPSVGSWVSYGLGTENQSMPGFVSINPPLRMGGPRNYGTAFLPAAYQGTGIGHAERSAKEAQFRFIKNQRLSSEAQSRQFDLLQQLNRAQLEASEEKDAMEATINSFELAFRMQREAPDVVDIEQESEATKALYGIGEAATDEFGRQCLLARKMAESGVRYVQINYADNTNNPKWDQHSNLPAHAKHAKATDRPVAGLLKDLKARGLLEDTLVWWGAEFGRMPFSQNNDGRDHNPNGFTMWLAGGGVKPGFAYGATDEYGFRAIENKIHMHDMHATLLHLLGIDHERLTYRHAGRDFRLTDVYGHVVHDIMA